MNFAIVTASSKMTRTHGNFERVHYYENITLTLLTIWPTVPSLKIMGGLVWCTITVGKSEAELSTNDVYKTRCMIVARKQFVGRQMSNLL